MLRRVRGKLASWLLGLALRLNHVRPGSAIIIHGHWDPGFAGDWAALAVFLCREHAPASPDAVVLPARAREAFVLRRESLVGRGPK